MCVRTVRVHGHGFIASLQYCACTIRQQEDNYVVYHIRCITIYISTGRVLSVATKGVVQ